jgi:hypothetical protein
MCSIRTDLFKQELQFTSDESEFIPDYISTPMMKKDTFKHKADKYSVHFQEMTGFKGKRKRGLTLTLYKKNPLLVKRLRRIGVETRLEGYKFFEIKRDFF